MSRSGNIGFGCSMITFDGKVAAVDESWCKFMELDRDEVLGRTFIDFVAPIHRPLGWQCFENVVGTGRGMLIKRREMNCRHAAATVDISVSVIPAAATTPALICSLYVPLVATPRIVDRREELIQAIGMLAAQLKGLTAEHQLPFLSSLLDMVALECSSTPVRSLQ